jgi:hypothetical protein
MNIKKNIKTLAQKAIKDEKYLTELVNNLNEKCAKRCPSLDILMHLTEKNPEKLYPKWDILLDIFKKGNTLAKYAVIYLIASLTKADKKKKFEKLFDDYFKLLNDKSIVVAAHAALNSGKIAKNKPKLEQKITKKLLATEKSRHKHKKILQACAMEAMSEYFKKARDKKKIIEFAKKQLEVGNPKAKKAAKEILKR